MDKLITRTIVQKGLEDLAGRITASGKMGSYNAMDHELAWYVIARDWFPDLLPIVDGICSRRMAGGGTTFYCLPLEPQSIDP